MFVIVFGMWRVDYDPFFALIVCVTMLAVLQAVSWVTCFVHDVERIHVRKHGNGGPNNHVFHCRNGYNKLVRWVVM